MTRGRDDVAALMALLQTERRLILEGAYADLGPLQDDKARLAAQLDMRAVDADDLARLHRQADANRSLLGAAREGLAAARARVCELERLVRGESGYDRDGARRDGTTDPRTLRRV